MVNKIIKIILIVILFLIFFEVGLFSSYTIVTAEVPNFQDLIDMQIDKISSIFNPNEVNEALLKDPTPLKIYNKKDVAHKMEELSKVDGVNVDSMNITTFEDTDNDEMNVTIEALGYDSPDSNSSKIVISQDPSYRIVATGKASYLNRGLGVDDSTISITSVLKLY